MCEYLLIRLQEEMMNLPREKIGGPINEVATITQE